MYVYLILGGNDMKKALVFLFVVMLAFAFITCGGESKGEDNGKDNGGYNYYNNKVEEVSFILNNYNYNGEKISVIRFKKINNEYEYCFKYFGANPDRASEWLPMNIPYYGSYIYGDPGNSGERISADSDLIIKDGNYRMLKLCHFPSGGLRNIAKEHKRFAVRGKEKDYGWTDYSYSKVVKRTDFPEDYDGDYDGEDDYDGEFGE